MSAKETRLGNTYGPYFVLAEGPDNTWLCECTNCKRQTYLAIETLRAVRSARKRNGSIYCKKCIVRGSKETSRVKDEGVIYDEKTGCTYTTPLGFMQQAFINGFYSVKRGPRRAPK